jgi:hypothetical protein
MEVPAPTLSSTPHANVTENDDILDVPPAVLARLRELTWIDNELYEAVGVLPQHCS